MRKYNKKKELRVLNLKDEELVNEKKKPSIFAKILDTSLNVILGAAICLNVRYISVYAKDYIDNEKIIPEVANELSVDLSIMQNEDFKDQIIKLKPNLNDKVYVYVEDDVSDKTRNNIQNSLDYFNDVFANINTNYQFQMCDSVLYGTNVALMNSTISFGYKEMGNLTYGATGRHYNRPIILKAIKEDWYYSKLYNIRSNIYLNKDAFDKLSDATQESIIRHELLHVFGIEDTYFGFKEEASLMNTDYSATINILSPKDMARLFVLYDENLIGKNNTINQQELTKVKEYLSEYENYYYSELATKIKDIIGSDKCLSISDEELVGYTTKINGVEIKIDENGNFDYFSKDGDEGKRTIIKGDNYVILPDIRVGKYEDYYVLLKTESGIVPYNMSVSHGAGDDKTAPIEDTIYMITR